jgi:FeS assembly SUF system protein
MSPPDDREPPSRDETPLLPLAPETPPAADAASGAPADVAAIEERVIEVLRSTFDPEIPVNIYDLGLVYGIDVDPSGAVAVRMTLTSPACPVAGTLPGEVEQKVAGIPGVATARVDLVWDPPWDPGKLSDAAKLQLGIL